MQSQIFFTFPTSSELYVKKNDKHCFHKILAEDDNTYLSSLNFRTKHDFFCNSKHFCQKHDVMPFLLWPIKLDKNKTALVSSLLRSNENNIIYFCKQLDCQQSRVRVVQPCSCVTCCVEIKLQHFSRKYIFICKIYVLLMQLTSAFLYDTC